MTAYTADWTVLAEFLPDSWVSRTVGYCAMVPLWAECLPQTSPFGLGGRRMVVDTMHVWISRLSEEARVVVLVFMCFPTVSLQPQFLPPSLIKIPMESVPSDPQNGIHCIASK